MISIWIETDASRGLGPVFRNMEQEKVTDSPTNWGNLALLVGAASALFHCIYSLDSNAMSFVGNDWKDYAVNMGILLFAMFTLAVLVSDRSTSKEQEQTSVMYEHGEPRGFQYHGKRNSSISWAD